MTRTRRKVIFRLVLRYADREEMRILSLTRTGVYRKCSLLWLASSLTKSSQNVWTQCLLLIPICLHTGLTNIVFILKCLIISYPYSDFSVMLVTIIGHVWNKQKWIKLSDINVLLLVYAKVISSISHVTKTLFGLYLMLNIIWTDI